MGEDKQQWLKEAVIGPLVVAFITGGLVMGGSAWARLVAVDHRLDQQAHQYAELHEQLRDIANEFRAFRKPGDRFTAQNGRDATADRKRIESRVNVLDQQCRGCAEKIGRLETQFEFFHRE